MRRCLQLFVILCGMAFSSACGQNVDLTKALATTDVFSGYYDLGVVEGRNKLVPSITFRLQNTSAEHLGRVQMLVSFWPEGADGERDSLEVNGVPSEGLAPGATTEPILVRSGAGYTLEQPPNELFTHSQFKDFIVKLFAKKAGKIVPLGEVTVERRIIPQASTSRLP